MEQSPERSVAMKSFAVAGFVVVIIFFVWLAIQVVSLLPGAFASLASIADGIYNERPQSEIMVMTPNNVINTNQNFTVTWSDLNRAGAYTFSYDCTDGVALDIKHPGSRITPVTCGEIVSLGSDIFSLDIMAQSERSRFTDVTYTIGFIAENDGELAYEKSSVFTVVNVNIPQSGLVEMSGDTVETPVETEVVTEVTTPAVATPVATTPAATTPGTPVTISTPIYAIPQSDPNGTIDLAVRYLQVGRLDSRNNFIPGGEFDADDRAAFQFEVKNIGTKTSGNWDFEANLTSGTTYTSKTQLPLKPNERSILTIGFDNVGDEGAQRFGATVTTPGDANTNNNAFIWAVFVTN